MSITTLPARRDKPPAHPSLPLWLSIPSASFILHGATDTLCPLTLLGSRSHPRHSTCFWRYGPHHLHHSAFNSDFIFTSRLLLKNVGLGGIFVE